MVNFNSTNNIAAVNVLVGLGTGVATFLATPSSANLASAVTNETGSGALVFADGAIVGSNTPCQVQAFCPTNYQTGTSYTMVIGDAGRMIDLSNAGAITLTIPPHGSVAFGAEAEIALFQSGAGQVTVSPGSGVTIISYEAKTKLSGQYAAAILKQTSTNDTWRLIGNLS